MRNLAFAGCVLALTLIILTGTSYGQVQSVAAANKQPAPKPPATDQTQANRTSATRARVTGQDAKTSPAGNAAGGPTLQAHAKTVSNFPPNTNLIRTTSTTDKASPNTTANRARTVSDNSAKKPGNNAVAPLSNTSTGTVAPVSAAASQVYRIGVRDVLDVQLSGQSGKQSTLFTVMEGGILEYPLAGGSIAAAGMTTSEVAALLRQRIKILDNPAVVVKVRDYASHPVTITGFVAAPGVKNLRREAVPLYTVLAEALMMPEAARATITRQGHAPIIVNLKDSNLASTPVLPGDSIKVSGMAAEPTEFFFVGGEISAPGQKPYHAGVTLTQAILASGGLTRGAGFKVRVSRQGADGRLLTEEYNLRKIQDGKNPDPVLQKGDRIQVTGDR
ncbi:MAG: polysaccharide biosynthesis/export family protein [Pyrinomonadaceae bacterium]|nr:polysaccharide biosynthesis/export family protein [Pyrinomonadaceae bacterium]